MDTLRRPAGTRLVNFLQSGWGEELGEGVVPAVFIGGAQLMDEDVPKEQALTNMALMATLGTGIGMGGRGAGAYIGKKLHPGEITNPHLAMMGSSIGQKKILEGMTEGLANQVDMMRTMSRESAARRVKDMQEMNPNELSKVLGVPADRIDELMPLVKKLDAHLESKVKSMDDMAASMKQGAEQLRNRKPGSNQAVEDGAAHLTNMLEGMGSAMEGKRQAVTGEHVGRAIGRMSGDEIGIGTGLLAGEMIGENMGWESPQQLKIKKLEREIKELGGTV